jgi:hypothetical protein
MMSASTLPIIKSYSAGGSAVISEETLSDTLIAYALP